MRIAIPFVIAALSFAVPAAAHEVWVERDGQGPARIYLGEPALPMPEGGDPELHRLTQPVVFLSDPAHAVATTRQADHLEAVIAEAGDVRVRDDSIFDPWKTDDGITGAIFYARAGRIETEAKLDLELVPVSAGASEFTVQFRGKPVPGATVNVITPDRWQKSFTADDRGSVVVPNSGAGRYVLGVSHSENSPGTIAGKSVDRFQHISTLTYVQ